MQAVQVYKEPKFALVTPHRVEEFLRNVAVAYKQVIEEGGWSEHRRDAVVLERFPDLHSIVQRNYFFYLEGVLSKELDNPNALADLICAGPDAWYGEKTLYELAQRYSAEPYHHYRAAFFCDVVIAINHWQLSYRLGHGEKEWMYSDAIYGYSYGYSVANCPIVEVW